MNKHIITDEEVKTAAQTYASYQGNSFGAIKKALTDFLANRPESTLGKLRPIAEMPETVPEGGKRVHWGKDGGWWLEANKFVTHAIDIQLPTPDPEAEERQRFEEAMKGRMWMPTDFEFKNGEYATPSLAAHYDTWKRAKAK